VRLEATNRNVEVFLFRIEQGTGYVNNSPLDSVDPLGLDSTIYNVVGGCIYRSDSTSTWTTKEGNYGMTVTWTPWQLLRCLPTQAQLIQSVNNQRPGSAQGGGGSGSGSVESGGRCASGVRGFGAGWVVGGSGAFGIGPNGSSTPYSGASGAAAYGGGAFYGEGQRTDGTFGSGGAALTSKGGLLNYPSNQSGKSNATMGAFAGVGGGLFLTNAGNSTTLRGSFTSYIASVGPVGIEFDHANGIKVLSVTVGKSTGFGTTRLQTNTFTTECR
jgi:hypothetical protein